jgi:tetratricopeptide (TPR) repeat protein
MAFPNPAPIFGAMQHYTPNLRSLGVRAPKGGIQLGYLVPRGRFGSSQTSSALCDIHVLPGMGNPMGKLFSRVALIALFMTVGLASAGATALDNARALMNQRQYDKAVVVLEAIVSKGNGNAEVYFELGRAYHWKRDFDNALKNYRKASELDKKYLTAPLPMLNHFKRYDEMMQIGETALSRGDRDVAVFSGLLNVYYDQKKTRDYERVLGMLRSHRYADPYRIDYQRYLLAKAEVRANQYEKAFTYIRPMKDKGLLQYMRTSGDFTPIAKDPRFIALTK